MKRTAGYAGVNGTHLWFDDTGTGSPLILIHGAPLDSRMWADQVEAFSARHRVIRYDVRGFGQSNPPTGSSYRHEDDLKGLLDTLHADHVAIVGLSAGARWAVDFAFAYPAMVSALILADPSVSGFPWPHDVQAIDAEISLTYQNRGVGAAKKLALGWPVFATAREDPEVARRLEQILTSYSGWHWSHDDPVVVPRPTAYERLEQIRVPTLVIVGERDLTEFRDVATALASRVPGAKLQTLPGVGHLTNMQAPREFNRAVLDFLASVSGTRTMDGVGAAGTV